MEYQINPKSGTARSNTLRATKKSALGRRRDELDDPPVGNLKKTHLARGVTKNRGRRERDFRGKVLENKRRRRAQKARAIERMTGRPVE